MAQKLIILAALVAVSSAVVIGPGHYPGPVGAYGLPALPALPALPVAKFAAPVVSKVVAPEPYDPNPQYSYSYDVNDPSTGDVKNQQETRSGDTVHGSYSLIEPDGTRRLVEYAADPVTGFNAVVHREPLAVKAVAPIAKVLAPAPILAHAPLIGRAVAPIGYPYGAPIAPLAPLAPYAHVAPVAKIGLPGLIHG